VLCRGYSWISEYNTKPHQTTRVVNWVNYNLTWTAITLNQVNCCILLYIVNICQLWQFFSSAMISAELASFPSSSRASRPRLSSCRELLPVTLQHCSVVNFVARWEKGGGDVPVGWFMAGRCWFSLFFSPEKMVFPVILWFTHVHIYPTADTFSLNLTFAVVVSSLARCFMVDRSNVTLFCSWTHQKKSKNRLFGWLKHCLNHGETYPWGPHAACWGPRLGGLDASFPGRAPEKPGGLENCWRLCVWTWGPHR